MTEHPEQEEQGANEDALAEYWQCPLCGTTVKHGYTVCTGCRAEIVYGLTRAEWTEAEARLARNGASQPAAEGAPAAAKTEAPAAPVRRRTAKSTYLR